VKQESLSLIEPLSTSPIHHPRSPPRIMTSTM